VGEPIAEFIGQLDEWSRLNILIQEREEREDSNQVWERLTLNELVERARTLPRPPTRIAVGCSLSRHLTSPTH
jgi:hypothetical protein